MTLPLISIIVPVYKTRDYLKECVDSIINQTYKRLEIILIDDGSPDDAGAMCDSFAKLDERIIVIHQENRGLSGARNAGLNIATGEYIAFVDSDDWLEPSCYEVCMSLLDATGADICCYDIYEVREGGKYAVRHMPNKAEQMGTFYARERIEMLFSLWPLVWAKVYKREFIEKWNLRFVQGILYEDNPFILACWIRNPLVVITNEHLHFYRMSRPGQISGVGQRRSPDVFKMLRHVENDFRKNDCLVYYAYLLNWSIGNILWLYDRTPKEAKYEFSKGMIGEFVKYLYFQFSLRHVCSITKLLKLIGYSIFQCVVNKFKLG